MLFRAWRAYVRMHTAIYPHVCTRTDFSMETEQIQKRIDELKQLISENNEHYYIENAPVISDYEFDMLMVELASIEKAHPELITPDSPTQRVGSDLSRAKKGSRKAAKEFEQYPHKYPMLSLGNTYSVTEIEEFADRAAKAIGDAFTYCCELKFDGTAICLTYRDGKLLRALTRGDGSVGDDVTENVKRIPNIPQRLNGIGWPKEFEIRGEIYMPYKAFDRLNDERRRDDEAPFANPRNAASGSLKLTDPDEVANRGLECTLYHILGEDLHFTTHDQALRCAMKWGLPVSDKRKICRNIVEIVEYVKYWDTERKFLPFATDGIVIKVNELPYQDSLGYTSKAPRWAVAYKFKAEQALSKVLSIDYQVGRTGAVTPVANLEPAQLSGTVVKRASLHNSDQMEVLDIRVGDYVYVEKGGEIIPKITGVELSKRDGLCVKPDFPTTCPDCGARLVRDEGEAKWFCPNVDGCPTQATAALVHFLSRKAMNVIAGDATIEQMYNKGYVRNVADFYKLDENKLLRCELRHLIHDFLPYRAGGTRNENPFPRKQVPYFPEIHFNFLPRKQVLHVNFAEICIRQVTLAVPLLFLGDDHYLDSHRNHPVNDILSFIDESLLSIRTDHNHPDGL